MLNSLGIFPPQENLGGKMPLVVLNFSSRTEISSRENFAKPNLGSFLLVLLRSRNVYCATLNNRLRRRAKVRENVLTF